MLANNINNLLLDSLVKHAVADGNLHWLCLLEEEPDAGLGNGGLGRLVACFLDAMATMSFEREVRLWCLPAFTVARRAIAESS